MRDAVSINWIFTPVEFSNDGKMCNSVTYCIQYFNTLEFDQNTILQACVWRA
jgi:hypothetical protein